jgi:O-antigen ligase
VRTPHTPLALFAAVVAFLLPVVFSPSVYGTFWSPAAAICLVVAAVGGVRLLRLTVHDRAARAAIAFVGAALVSALLAHNRTIAFFGLYQWGTGWLFVLSLAGAWAIGRSVPLTSRRLVEDALLAAVLLNASVALLELVFDLSSLHLGKYGGRAPGLVGNPVHLGGLCAAGFALLAPRLESGSVRWGFGVIAVAAATQASGSRAGGALLVLATLVAVARLPRRRWWLAAFVFVGVVGGAGLASIGGGVAVTQRVQDASGGGGYSARLATWRAAITSIGERPLLGVGPGSFRDAVATRRSTVIARSEGPERMFVDAHNLAVEYAATTGLVGLALLAIWLAFALRGASGSLLWFGLIVLANHAAQPQAVRTTPVALLAVGVAAATTSARGLRPARVERAAFVIAGVLAVAAAGTLLVGDFHLEQGNLDFIHSQAAAANRLLPAWPEPATLQGRIYLFDERITRRPSATRDAIAWFREAAERDERNPMSWTALGGVLLGDGRTTEARAAYAKALRANPVSVVAMNGIASAWRLSGHTDRACEWYGRSLAVVEQRAVERQRATVCPDAARGQA